MASWKRVQKERLQRQEEAGKKHLEELNLIKPQLEAMQAADRNFSLKDFLGFLYSTHPPKSGKKLPDDLQRRSITMLKRVLLEAIREYSPSNQAQYFKDGDATVPKDWSLLCGEIQKILNRHYEDNFKTSPSAKTEDEKEGDQKNDNDNNDEKDDKKGE